MNKSTRTWTNRWAWGAIVSLLTVMSARVNAAESVILSNAVVHTIAGETLSPGQVLISQGRIAAVGRTVAGEGAAVVDLSGQHLYPGLIALNTVLGLTEIS